VLLVATCEKPDDIIGSFARHFKDKMAFKNPERADREAIIDWMLAIEEKLKNIDIDLDTTLIAKFLQGKNIKEIRSTLIKATKGSANSDAVLKKLGNIEKERRAFGEKAVKIPEVKWADVGGLASAKEDIM